MTISAPTASKAVQAKTMETDLTIIGAGMTGIAAALFARNRKMSTVLVGQKQFYFGFNV